MTVEELKIDLVKSSQVGFPIQQFELAKIVREDDNEDNDDAYFIVDLDDYFVPLHHYWIQSDANLTVVSSFIMINILNVNGEYLYKRVSKDMTISELKSDILHYKRLCTAFDFSDVVMFIKGRNDIFVELGIYGNYSVSELLAIDNTLYLTADTYFKSHYPLYFNGSEIGKIGVVYQESVLNIKLWTQVQTGIPVSSIRVLKSPPVPVKPKGNQSPIGRAQNPGQNVNSNSFNDKGSITGIADNVKLFEANKHYIEIF